jgi:hypothetical protein
MKRRDEEEKKQYILQTAAIHAAREAAGVDQPARPIDDPWWFEGPHIEKDERSYYVHALGAFPLHLAQAIRAHPDWYLVVVLTSGGRLEIYGLDDEERVTLEDFRTQVRELSADELRLAAERTLSEKGR